MPRRRRLDVDEIPGIWVTPQTSEPGIVIKLPDSNYGSDPYTSGEFVFAVAEEGAGVLEDATAAGAALFRIDRFGGIGTTGGIHVATGFRKATGGSVAVWIDPAENVTALAINNPTVAESATWTADFLNIIDSRNSDDVVFRINAAGQTLHHGGALGAPGISWADDPDTGIVNLADNTMGFVTQGTQRFAVGNTQISIADTVNLVFNTSTGSKIGTAQAQKLAFWGNTPIVRPTGVLATAAAIHVALQNIGLIGS